MKTLQRRRNIHEREREGRERDRTYLIKSEAAGVIVGGPSEPASRRRVAGVERFGKIERMIWESGEGFA